MVETMIVELSGVSKSFRDGNDGGKRRVLENVSLAVKSGESLSVVGHSGCGKSTLLRLLAGLERPSTGSICFDEREVTKLEPKAPLETKGKTE